MKFIRNDGGRAAAGFKGEAGDCVTRAIAIATGEPYSVVYTALNELAKGERTGKRKRRKSSSREGVYKPTIRKYMESIGWLWVPCMTIGSGCKVHLDADELPAGRLVVSVSKHSVAVIDGVLHDTSDCSREGRRCVYGYFRDGKPRRVGKHPALAMGYGRDLEPKAPAVYSPAYEQLERCRNLLLNAEASPLADVDEQASARYHLLQLRAIYRLAVDRESSK